MIIFVGLLLAIVALGVGLTLLEPVKVVTNAIFVSFRILETAPPGLYFIVSLWPVWILLAFFVIAFMQTRRA